ncbi:MAG: oxidoreductase-like domain-containing protein [Dokdonella sp.]
MQTNNPRFHGPTPDDAGLSTVWRDEPGETSVSGVPDPPPPRPLEPDPADCCGEGCVNCVFDSYEVALERYRTELDVWRERNANRDASE